MTGTVAVLVVKIQSVAGTVVLEVDFLTGTQLDVVVARKTRTVSVIA